MSDTELPEMPKYVFVGIMDVGNKGIIIEIRYHDLQELVDVITKGSIELGLTKRVWCTGNTKRQNKRH